MTASQPDLSWVVPLYRNGAHAREVVLRTHAAAEALGLAFEVIFVDDRCPEESGLQAEEALHAHPGVDGRVLFLAVNHGQDAAIREGLRACTGLHALAIDGDLQDPPEMLSALWPAMQHSKADVVFAARHGNYESRERRATSWAFRKTMEWVGGLPPRAGACALLNQRAISSILSTRVRRLSLVAALASARLNCISVPVERAARSHGRSAYSEWARLARAINSLALTVRGRWLRIPL